MQRQSKRTEAGKQTDIRAHLERVSPDADTDREDEPAQGLNLNEYAVIMCCPSCSYTTAVYAKADLDMFDDNKTGYPECPVPKCHGILEKAKEQYREL